MRFPRSGLVFAIAVAATGCGGSASPRPVAPAGAAAVVAPSAITPGPRVDGAAATASPAMSTEDAPLAAVTADDPTHDDRPHVTSIGQTSWIYKHPEATEANYLGYIRSGSSVAVRSLDPTAGVGCPGGFYETLPRGFLCSDHTVSVHPPEAYMRVIRETRPHRGPLPYRYALSDGAPMYNRVPSAKEIADTERFMGKPHEFSPLFPTLRAHEELASSDPIEATHPLPSFLEGAGSTRPAPFDLVERTIPRGSMLSFEEAFTSDGRVYLLSTDHTIVPADRVRAYRPTAFHGTRLGDDIHLPIAWMRGTPRTKYELVDGAIVATDDTWAVRAFVELTGRSNDAGGRRYLETRETGAHGARFVLETDATVAQPASERPFGVKAGQKWILVSISRGTLVAYDDLTPVYATLVSPGAGGVPTEGHDPVKDSTTPIGTFTITFKDRAATMSPDKGSDRTFWIADVPYTQYFHAPFALHAAYWHERFGEPTSAGCVNLAPVDAQILFDWTDPPVPDEWQGVTGAGAHENGASTEVVVRR